MNKTIKSDCEKAVAAYNKTAKTFQIQDKAVNN